MNAEQLAGELQAIRKFFERSTSVLEEPDSGFTPVEGMYSLASQVYHVASTIDWFLDGTFGKGWDMDFAKHDADARDVKSLTEARAALARAFENAEVIIMSQSEEKLQDPFPADDPIMPGQPRSNIISAINDHTAHHRGALTVYARLLGKSSPMPYM